MVEEAMQNHWTAFEEIKISLIHSGLDRQSAIDKAMQIFYLRFKRN